MTATSRSPIIDDPVLIDFADQVGASGPVTVAGSKSRWNVGGDLDAGTREIAAPTGIVEYKPEEMTVRVRVGTPVAELGAALAQRGQHCALPDRGGTVGGAIAVGEDDVRVLGVGRVRTATLQVRYVAADGLLVTGGGPTVKNVTGFDLPRLMTGSLGTLGLLCEVILRTNPIPPTRVLLTSDDCDPFAVPDTVLRPTLVLYDGQRTWVELAGHAQEVEAERQRLASTGSFTPAGSLPVLEAHRWSMTPAELRSLSRDDADMGPWVASIGVGTVFARRPQPPRPLSPGVQLLHDRMKEQFDPSRRLNPGRSAANR